MAGWGRGVCGGMHCKRKGVHVATTGRQRSEQKGRNHPNKGLVTVSKTNSPFVCVSLILTKVRVTQKEMMDFGKILPSVGDSYYCTHHIVMQLGELFSSKTVCGSHSVSTLIPVH